VNRRRFLLAAAVAPFSLQRLSDALAAAERRRRRHGCDDLPMRIIAGSRRGHTIHAPRGEETRPTSDRVRENVFNLLGPVDGASVLDLFAGSGALGLEALSRGASRAVFVDSEAHAVAAIERNLDKLRLTGTVLQRDAIAALAAEAAARRKYDLVLVDPPYDMYPDLQPQLARYLPAVLAAGGLLVVETGARVEPELPFAQRTSRRYGQARVTVLEA
jgi:16S rRNA (guanine966-N2)-methyltransferase